MMDLLPSEDQEQILDAARVLLHGKMDIDRLRKQIEGDAANQCWSDLVEFGWFTLALAEDDGGAGLGLAEEMLLFREAGRYVLPVSVLGTSLAAHLAARAGDAEFIGAVAEGAARAGLAVPNPAAGEAAWLLIDAADATHAVATNGVTFKLLALGAFADRHKVPSIDEAISLERARLVKASGVGEPDDAIARWAVVLAAAMLTGIAEAARDLAVEYAGLREQFGQVIGAFQAVKHRCADMALRAEAATAQVSMAALAEENSLPGADFQVRAAALTALEAARANGASCIQVHGGMGFTWECHAHRFVKRADVLAQVLGGRRAVQERLLSATRVD